MIQYLLQRKHEPSISYLNGHRRNIEYDNEKKTSVANSLVCKAVDDSLACRTVDESLACKTLENSLACKTVDDILACETSSIEPALNASLRMGFNFPSYQYFCLLTLFLTVCDSPFICVTGKNTHFRKDAYGIGKECVA